MIYTCKICGETFHSSRVTPLQNHLLTAHNITIQDYLRQYEPEKGGYCKTCGKETTFLSYNRGFLEFCSSQCANNDVKVKEKKVQTFLKKYDVENPFQSSEIKNKIKRTNLERYGVDNVSKSDIVIERKKKTNLIHYGTEWVLQSSEIKDKIKQTNLERYGVDNVAKSKKIQDKIKQTNLERYGFEHPLQSFEILDKLKQTNLERYGINYSAQSEEIKKKIKTICLKKFNSTCWLTSEKYTSNKKNNYYSNFKEKLLKIKNIQLLDSKNDFVGNNVYHYHCNIHNVDFESKESNSLRVICPKCHEEHSCSVAENSLFQWLNNIISCEQHNKTILKGKELDIYIPSKRIAIEFDGLYWHSNEFKDKRYHLEKTIACENQQVQLIHVFENEWIEKPEIVKSVILAKLGIFQERIPARKCKIELLSNEEYKDFININHLQGYVPATTKLGLFYEGKLVQICSFGKSRFHKNETELLRQCSSIGIQVIGGFSKLLNYYIKNYQPKNLVTYCDRRYSNGSGHLNSGWELVSETEPNYFYFKGLILESRMKYQKHHLYSILESFDKDLTEQENMYINGFKWIYDCGNLKFKRK